VNAVRGLALALFALVLPWTIAPMNIGFALLAAATLPALLRERTRRPWGPLWWPALAWVAALALAAALSGEPAACLKGVAKGLYPLAVGVIAFAAREPRLRDRAVAVLLASAALAALFGLALWVAKGASFEFRARGAVGHYMTFAGQLMLFAALAAGIAAAVRSRAWRWGSLAVFAALGLVLALTQTRSAWIGLLVALATVLALTRPRWLAGLAVLLVVALFAGPAALRERALSAIDPHHVTNVERTHMWEAGARMFRERPLTGLGPRDLKPLYDRYKSPEAREPAGHLHNVVVQVAATTGTVGLAAFVWLYGTLLTMAARGLRAQLARRDLAAGLRLGVLAALLGFLVAGVFEWNFGDEELLYPLYTLVGLAWAAHGGSAAAAAATASPRAGRETAPAGGGA
jgi:O-antigen ligase